MNKEILEVLSLIKKANNTKEAAEKQIITDEILNKIDGNIFVKALKTSIGYTFTNATEDENTVYNSIQFGLDNDYGYLMPNDVKTAVESLRKEGLSLETLVKVEKVEASEGKRVYDLSADTTPLETVDKFGEIPKVDPSKLKDVKFKTVRKAGIVEATLELVKDSDKALLDWIKKWSAKKSRATRNKMIIDKINEIAIVNKAEAADIDALRNLILTNLADSYKENAIALINYAGYEYLDNLKDLDGNKVKVFEPVSNNSKEKLLFGLYPVKVLPDNLFANTEGKVSIIVGAYDEAVVLFDRDKLLIKISKTVGFFKDFVSIKLIEKLDIKEVDTAAVIKVELPTN